MSKDNNGISLITNRYACALADLAEKTEQLDDFNIDLSKIKSLFDSNIELKFFLEHPTIPLGDKKEIIEKIFKDSVSQYVLNLLKLLLDRNRINLLSGIASSYTNILNEKKNITIAKVVTAIEIPEYIKEKLKNKLKETFSTEIYIETQIDPAIIAGMIVKIGDKIIDGSIRARLDNLKRQLI